MKKGAKPELSQKWWSKNKAKTLKKTGLGAALKDYEVAVELGDNKRMLNSLSAVKKKLAVAFGACDRKRHAESLEALKKYPGIIQKKETAIKKSIKEAAAKAAKAVPAAPKQKIGKKIVIWQRDVAEEVKKKYKPQFLAKFTGFVVKLRLNDDILDVLEAEGDYVTPQFMIEDAQDLCAASVEKIIKEGKRVESVSKSNPAATGKITAAFKVFVVMEVKDLGKEVAKIPALRWNKFVARKKQYKTYKIQAGFDVAIGTLQLAGGGLAIAGAAATGGASLALAIVGTVRGVASLAQVCHDLAQKTEKVQKDLNKDLNKLQVSYLTLNNKAMKSMGVKEIGKSTLAALVSAHPPFMASIPKCQKNFDLWSDKVAGLAVKGRDLSKQTLKLLGQIDALEKQLRTDKSKAASKTLDKLRKLRPKITNTFDKAATVNGRVKKADVALPKVAALLKILKSSNPDYAKIFDRVFPAVVNLAFAGAGAGVGFSEAKSALDTANTALGLSNDILSELKTQLQAAA